MKSLRGSSSSTTATVTNTGSNFICTVSIHVFEVQNGTESCFLILANFKVAEMFYLKQTNTVKGLNPGVTVDRVV